MQKKSFVKKMKSFLRPIYFGLGIFAITGLAFYVFAAITFPSAQPNPTTGIVGMFVGVSTTKYSAAISHYDQANATCSSLYPNSHVCASMELMNSYNNGNTVIAAQTGAALVNNGPPGYTSFSNDCLGWTNYDGAYGGLPVYGAIWDFTKKFGKLNNCGDIVSAGLPFACCL